MNRELVMIAIVLNTIFIFGGVAVILMAMYQRGRTREMQHRERIAMIERGLMPPPERNPAAFNGAHEYESRSAATSIGIVIVALGLGLMLLIGFTANAPDVAVGIGGAISVIGGAFIVIGETRRRSFQPPRSGGYPPGYYPPPSGPADPRGPGAS